MKVKVSLEIKVDENQIINITQEQAETLYKALARILEGSNKIEFNEERVNKLLEEIEKLKKEIPSPKIIPIPDYPNYPPCEPYINPPNKDTTGDSPYPYPIITYCLSKEEE